MSKKILIVEDDRSLGRVMTLKLSKVGFEVDHAENGEVGLEKIKNGSYDVILLDLVMPKVNGFDVLKELDEQKSSTPVLILSNLGQNEDKERTSKYDMVKDYVVKSNISLDDVIEKINKHLNE